MNNPFEDFIKFMDKDKPQDPNIATAGKTGYALTVALIENIKHNLKFIQPKGPKV